MSVLLILAVSQAQAQMPRPSLTVEGTFFGKARFDDPPVIDLAERPVRIGVAHFAGSLMYPVIFDHGKTMFFFEAAYHQRQFSFSDWPEGVSKDIDRLHEVSAGFTIRRAISRDWAVTLNLTPQLASNFEGNKLHEEDFKFQGAVIVEKAFDQRWTAGLGVSYSTTFGSLLPLPVLTFRYESGNRWRASGTLPSDIDLWYRLSSGSELGIVAHAEGGMYHIPGAFPEDFSIKDPELQYISVLFGPAIQKQLGGMTFVVNGGLDYQSLRLFDGVDEIDNSKYDLKPGVYVNTSVEISF